MKRDLYQKQILDHAKRPRHFGALSDATHVAEGHNPLCGDRLEGFFIVEDGHIRKTSFQGDGCAISLAAASLLAGELIGRTCDDARQLLARFADTLTQEQSPTKKTRTALGKPSALLVVRAYPSRIKCASLPSHMFLAALNETQRVSTE